MEPDVPEWIPDPSELVSHYIKIYPDRFKLIKFKTPYQEQRKDIELKGKPGATWLQPEEDKPDSLVDSLARTKTRLSDLTICNAFELMTTFTLNCHACIPKCYNDPCTCNPKTCTRYDLNYAIRTVSGWYNNFTKRYGTFPRVQVMELHKENEEGFRAYHFHSLWANFPGKLKFWRIDEKDGRPLYNVVSYRKGFSTAKYIYDVSGASSYVRKYIMKDMPVFPGKKRYWPSRNLNRPIITQDESFAEEILSNANSEIWQPEPLADTTAKRSTDNIESITTLMADNKDAYLQQVETLKRVESLLKGKPV